MIYQWKSAARIKADANLIGTELRRIETEMGGLRPVDVVEIARSPQSPLHSQFDWDVERAAQAHWENHARYIIRSIIMIDDSVQDAPKQVRAFVNLNIETDTPDEEEPAYINITTVLGTPALRAQLLNKALKEIEAFERRYQEFINFETAIDAIGLLKRELARAIA